MSTKPTHTAYIVTEPKEGSDRKATWHEIGAVWPHKNGDGFDIVIPQGLSVSGRIVCTKCSAAIRVRAPGDQDEKRLHGAVGRA